MRKPFKREVLRPLVEFSNIFILFEYLRILLAQLGLPARSLPGLLAWLCLALALGWWWRDRARWNWRWPQTLALGIALASVLLATLPPRKTASPASAQQ